MVQRLKVLVTVSDDLRSIARTHVVERELTLKVVL